MKIYVAAPLPYIEEAKACRAVVRSFGHEVVSSWMDLACASPEAEAELSEEDRVDLGITCLMDVSSADVVLWLYGKKSTRSGAVAEAGFAIGKGKMVLAVPLSGYSRADFPTVVLEGWVVHEATPVDALRKLDSLAPKPRAHPREKGEIALDREGTPYPVSDAPMVTRDLVHERIVGGPYEAMPPLGAAIARRDGSDS